MMSWEQPLNVRVPHGEILGGGADAKMPVREIDQEFNRQADLLEDMEKALEMLRRRLQPVLCAEPTKAGSNSTAVPVAMPRQSPVGATMHSRNERLNHFVGQLHIICQELAI